jgi:transposase-like protein
MIKQSEKSLIRTLVENINEEKRAEFRSLGYKKTTNRYSQEQKDYAINLTQESGVRATAKILGLHRKNIQRWLRT